MALGPCFHGNKANPPCSLFETLEKKGKMEPPLPVTDVVRSPKERVIAAVYYHRHGFGGVEETLQKAQAQDASITKEDVQRFLAKQKTYQDRQTRGIHNSYVPNGPKAEYQVDVAHFPGSKTARYGCFVLDIFTKVGDVYPLDQDLSQNVVKAVLAFCDKHGIPDSICTDGGPDMSGKLDHMCQWLKVQHIVLRGQGPRFVDRYIRTVREGISQRMLAFDKQVEDWPELAKDVVEKLNAHIGAITPTDVETLGKDATDPGLPKELNVGSEHEIQRIWERMRQRQQPFHLHSDLHLHDKVRILKAVLPRKLSESSRWGDTVHTVTSITHHDGGTLYDVSGHGKPLVRTDLLKVPNIHAASQYPVVQPFRPLSKRLTVTQQGLKLKYEKYLTHAVDLLRNGPLLVRDLGRQLELPIRPLTWVQLYPETLKVQNGRVHLLDHLEGRERFQRWAETRRGEVSKRVAKKTIAFFRRNNDDRNEDRNNDGRNDDRNDDRNEDQQRFRDWVETRQRVNSERAARRTRRFFNL
jgi:hypothetical protein